MKFNANEEYGLRCLIQLGRAWPDAHLTIPEISEMEGISQANVAKMLRILREGGFVNSVRGQAGGYTLARDPVEISISEAMAALGGRLYDEEFCRRFSGSVEICNHKASCTVKSLWSHVQDAVDDVLSQYSLANLLGASRAKRLAEAAKEPAEV